MPAITSPTEHLQDALARLRVARAEIDTALDQTVSAAELESLALGAGRQLRLAGDALVRAHTAAQVTEILSRPTPAIRAIA